MNYLIKKCNGKPSSVLQAMIDGLLASQSDVDFEVNMNTYGYVEDNFCYGCAATCTIAKLIGLDATTWVSIKEMPNTVHDIADLELAIENSRVGNLVNLFELCCIPHPTEGILHDFMNLWSDCVFLKTDNWQGQLPLVQELVDELRELGY